MAEVEDLIGTSEAARILAVSTREVRRKAAEGSLPAEAVEGPGGREWRYRRKDVEAYRRARVAGRPDGRTDMAAVRPLLAAQDRATAAAEQLAERLEAMADLPDALRENTGAIRALLDELRAAREDRDALADELRQARETIDELQVDRRRGWWHRLLTRR